MSCSHVLVKRIYRLCPRHLPILLVHIVCTGARIVADPDAKVLDLCRTLFVYLIIDSIVSPCSADSRKPWLLGFVPDRIDAGSIPG